MKQLIEAAKAAVSKKATGANLHMLQNMLGNCNILLHIQEKTGQDKSAEIKKIINDVYKKIGG